MDINTNFHISLLKEDIERTKAIEKYGLDVIRFKELTVRSKRGRLENE